MKLLKLLVPCLVACLSSIAQAGDCGNWAMATIYGYNGGWNVRPAVVNNFTPPYFAMHPPVYYGERYYRPYGDSPFASWPQLQANPAYMPRTQPLNQSLTTIDNPHYVPSVGAPAVPHPAPAQPAHPEAVTPKVPDVVRNEPTGKLTIENPYFVEPAQYIKKAEGNGAAH